MNSKKSRKKLIINDLLRLLPFDARMRWRDIFYTRVFPKDNSANMYTPDGKIKNIVEQYKLPPIKSAQPRIKPEELAPVKVESINETKNNNKSNNTESNGVTGNGSSAAPNPTPTPSPPPPPLPPNNATMRL